MSQPFILSVSINEEYAEIRFVNHINQWWRHLVNAYKEVANLQVKVGYVILSALNASLQ